LVQPVVIGLERFAQHGEPFVHGVNACLGEPARTPCAIDAALDEPRTFELAGCVISKGSASSITVASPLASRARIARRVGSAKAAKAASRFNPKFISINLYK